MTIYQCVADKRTYTEEQMRELFRFKEYRGYIGTFEDWIKEELDNRHVINYTEKKSDMSLQNILEYAQLHDLKYGDICFKHDNGKKFKVLDADMGLFSVEGKSGFFTLSDLEVDYEDEPVFKICS